MNSYPASRTVFIRRTIICLIFGLAWMLVLLYPSHIHANEGAPIVTPSDKIYILATLPEGDFSAAIRLTASQTITNVQILVTDLHDATGDGRQRDPMPASSVEISPQPSVDTLEADSLIQFVVKVSKPPVTGIYSGTLTLRWHAPDPNQLELPLWVEARSVPTLAVQDPETLSVTGRYTRQIQRRVLLRETSGGAITGLQVLPQDMLKVGTGFVLPAHKLRAIIDSADMQPGELVTATLKLDLSMVPAGEYKGKVVIKGDPDIFLAIPLTLKVAHQWFWPFLAVIAGVLLGLWLTSYVSKGKIRDEYVVRLNELREMFRGDSQLYEESPPSLTIGQELPGFDNPQHGFSQALRALEIEIDAAIRQANYILAEEKSQFARDLINKWRTGRSNWLKQITYLREVVIAKIDELNSIADKWELIPVPTQRLIRKTESAITAAHTYDNASGLRDEIDIIMGLLNKHRHFDQAVTDGEARFGQLSGEENSQDYLDARDKLTTIKSAWASLRIDDENEVGNFEANLREFEALLQKLELASNAQPKSANEASARDALEVTSLNFPAPELDPEDAFEPVAARRRLQQYWYIVYFFAAFLLSMVGLATIYLDNETFGSNLLVDYLTLFLFGLGAESTVASTAGLLTRLGIPSSRA